MLEIKPGSRRASFCRMSRRAIGLLFSDRSACDQAREFLISSGMLRTELYTLKNHYDACMVRRGGGLVVHVTAANRPHFPGHQRADGVTVEVGDLVIDRAQNAGEYLPRLLSAILREVQSAGCVSDN